MIAIEWIVTIVIAYVIARFAVKFDLKHNDGWVTDDFSDMPVVVIIVLIIPYVNILGAIVLWVNVLWVKYDNNTNGFMEKFFMIHKKNGNEKKKQKLK